MSATGRETPTGLNEHQVIRLFKCAVKDDDTLVDAIVERLYGIMKEFDAGRAKQAIKLIVDRDTRAASKLEALLDDLRPVCPSKLAA
jgi:phage tail tube protein FII